MYKIIYNEKIIDVVESPHFFKILSNGNIAFTDRSSAHGIVSSNSKELFAFKPIAKRELKIVTIEKITLEELNKLKDLLSSGQEPIADIEAFEASKQLIIKRLSSTCKSKITTGFSVMLSDYQIHNFKLTAEDQLNLMSIENQLNSGAKTFVYHSTNQPCKVFSRKDITKIIEAYRRHITYHTTYFNVAKQYINSLTDIDKVNNFTYGDDVLDIVSDKVIKKILTTGGNL